MRLKKIRKENPHNLEMKLAALKRSVPNSKFCFFDMISPRVLSVYYIRLYNLTEHRKDDILQ